MVYFSDHSEKVFPGELPTSSKRSSYTVTSDKPPKTVREGGITATQALINLVRGMVGPGCLSLPLAFKQAGLWAGLALMIIFGFITYFSYRKLVKCSQYLVKEYDFHSLDYGSMAEESLKMSFKPLRKLSTFARHFVNFCLFLMQIGICSVFVVFIKEHIYEVVNYEYPKNGVGGWVYYLGVVVALCVLCLIRNLRTISIVSMAGNILMTASLIVIFQKLVRSPHILDQLPAYESVGGIVLSAGSILYAFEGQAMILPLENKMKHPRKMLGGVGVLIIGCITVTIIYVLCGFFGYITYGRNVRGSIALNLPDTPLYFALKVLLALVVFTSYLIQQFVIVDVMWPVLKDYVQRGALTHQNFLCESIFKTLLVLLSFLIAIGVPNLDNIIPLVGVSAGMLLALIIPAILETTTFLPVWLEKREYLTMANHMFWNSLFFIFGIFFLITGIITNMRNIIEGHQ